MCWVLAAMKVIDPGHLFELCAIDGGDPQTLQFVKRFRGPSNHGGVQNQEVLRALISRTLSLQEEKPSPLTEQAIHHMRMALVLHEARALIRKVEKGELEPERIVTDTIDGHFLLRYLTPKS